jgi:hypothetical protein
MERLPEELYNNIIEFLPIYSIIQVSKVNKFYNNFLKEKGKRYLEMETKERKKQLMVENSDGIGIGGEEILVCHNENDLYWKKEYYESPWSFRWKLKYVWWLDVSSEINLHPGCYSISCILWNVYETVFSEIKLLNQDNYIIKDLKSDCSVKPILRKFECPGIMDFPKYKANIAKYINEDFPKGQIIDITDKTLSEQPISISLLKKYRYLMGEIEIKESQKIQMRIFNVNCLYHKDNMIFECFRVKKIN